MQEKAGPLISSWMNIYIKTCRTLSTAVNGDIVDALLRWIKLRAAVLAEQKGGDGEKSPTGDDPIAPCDANALLFMLGRNKEYELLVLLFKCFAEISLGSAGKDVVSAEISLRGKCGERYNVGHFGFGVRVSVLWVLTSPHQCGQWVLQNVKNFSVAMWVISVVRSGFFRR